MASVLAEMARIARLAGERIEAVRARGVTARDKADRSPVTEADLEADALIRQELTRSFPGDGWLSEESEDVAGTTGVTWVVDPLDGTEAFVDGRVRGYAVQIARVEGGVVTHGVVFEPAVGAAGELFAAERGRGATCERDGVTEPLRTRDVKDGLKLITSTRVAAGFRDALFAAGLGDGGMYRSVGVKVGFVARGLADVYPATHGLAVWDVAAPAIVLEEAGGRVTDFDEGAILWSELVRPGGARALGDAVLFSHGATHGHWCRVLRELRAQRRNR